MPKLRFIVLVVFLAAVMSGCGLSMAEDIQPPANYREPPADQQPSVDPSPQAQDQGAEQQPEAQGTLFPLVPPDPAQGKLIYMEKCLPCHGETGMGDGPQAANLANPPAPLGSPDLARHARPVDWYQMVTNGNIERFMPGFASLNDRQRWDVVAYALTLHANQAELNEGKQLYDQNCAACHGLTGLGDGEQASSNPVKPASWYEQDRLAALSAEDMTKVMAGGKPGHTDFSTELDENQRYAIASYVRALSFTNPSHPVAENQQQADNTNPASKITVSGQISNASPGGSLPEGMQVTLLAFDQMTPAFELAGEVSSDGTYTIPDVEYNPGYVYFAQVDANGLTFNSDIIHGADVSGDKVDLPVQIYDTTTSKDRLLTDRLHVFFDFSTPGKIQVINLFIISNLGDQVVTSEEPDGPVLEFQVPEGAENLQFQDGELGGRFVETQGGFGDRMSIMPGQGQHQVLFAYELPYVRKLNLEIPVPLPVDSAIVMLPPQGVKLKSDQLQDAGQKDVQGMSYQMYQGTQPLEAGSTLPISLSGGASVAGEAEQDSSMNYLMIGLGVFGVALAAFGFWLYRMRSGQQLAGAEAGIENSTEDGAVAPELYDGETSEALIDAIVALDDRNAAGELPEAAYQQRRAELKARLAEALKREE